MLKFKTSTTINNELKKDYGSKLIQALKATYKKSRVMDFNFSESTFRFEPKINYVGRQWNLSIESGQIIFSNNPENVTLKYQVSFPYLPLLFPFFGLLIAHLENDQKEYLLYFFIGFLPTIACYSMGIMWLFSRKLEDMGILKKEISMLEQKYNK